MACNTRKFKTAGAESRRQLIEKGAINQYNEIVDYNLFKKLNRQWSLNAKERFGTKQSIFLEENGKVYVNKTVTQEIDRLKGVNYTPSVLYSRHAGLNDVVDNHEQPDKPLGDNYAEFLKYKHTQHREISKDIEIARANAKNSPTAENRAKLKELQKLSKQIENQLEMLEKNEVDYMFHAVNEDLARIRATLASKDLHSVQDASDKLEFYKDFVGSLAQYDHEDFDKISGEISKLDALQKTSNEEKIKEFLENEELTQALLENLNKDEKLKKRLIEERDLKGEAAREFEITVEDLLIANADINWADLKILGTISDNTGNTIIPQALMVAFKRVLSEKQAHASDIIARFEEVERDTGIKDPDWIVERDANGNPTEFVTDVFSAKWFNALKGRGRMVSGFIKALRADKSTAAGIYHHLINWYKDNSVVIDFTRLRAVREIYGSQYSSHFMGEEHQEEHVDSYEASLKKQLGPRYEETIAKVLSKLQEFEELKATAAENFGDFAEKNVASSDIWEFNKQYKGGVPGHIRYKYGVDQEASTYFTAFDNLVILPKTRLQGTKVTDEGFEHTDEESGYYNPEFQTLMKDANKLKYWNAIKDMSNYLDVIYSRENQGRISYPKRLKSATEMLLEDLALLKKNPNLYSALKLSGKAIKNIVSAWGSMYTDGTRKGGKQEGVQTNYTDEVKRAITSKTQAYMLQGYPQDTAKEMATTEALKYVSNKTGANFKAAVLEAALHESRLEIEPVAKAALQRFKNIKDIEGNERKNAIKKLEFFVDKVILNKSFGSKETDIAGAGTVTNMPLAKKNGITKDWLMTRNALEKELVTQWKAAQAAGHPVGEMHITDGGMDLHKTLRDEENPASPEFGEDPDFEFTIKGIPVSKEEFDKAYGMYLINKINSIGSSVTPSSFIQGIIGTLYVKALGLSPTSGIFNRIEGKHSAILMDSLGKFWTRGNIHTANNFLALSNIIRLSNHIVPLRGKKHKEQLQIFEEVVKRLGVLQDKKSEIEKQDTSTLNKFSSFVFSFAVDNPEFKNQGAVMHSVIQDSVITDSQGNEHPMFDTNSMTFTPFEMINGALHIKPDFALTDEGGFSFDSVEMGHLILKMETAISHSQGNYNASDALELQSSIWGKVATTFTRWLPEALNSRFGVRGSNTKGEINASLIMGGEKTEGRYISAGKASATSLALFAGTGLAIPFGLIGAMSGVGLGVVGSIALAKWLNDTHPRAELRSNLFFVQETGQFLRSVLVESLNFYKAVGYRKTGTTGLDIRENKSFTNLKYMTKEDVGALQSMTKELAIGLNLLALSLAVEALRYGLDDDEEESKKAKFLNYVVNELHKSSNSLTIYSNPQTFFTDHSKLAVVSEIGKILGLINPPSSDKATDWQKTVRKLPIPIPSVFFKEDLPLFNKEIYAERKTNMAGDSNPFYYSTHFMQNMASGGELETGADYKALRFEKHAEFEEQFTEAGLTGEELKKAVNKAMRKEFPRKKKGETYEHLMDRIEAGEKGGKKKRRRKSNY